MTIDSDLCEQRRLVSRLGKQLDIYLVVDIIHAFELTCRKLGLTEMSFYRQFISENDGSIAVTCSIYVARLECIFLRYIYFLVSFSFLFNLQIRLTFHPSENTVLFDSFLRYVDDMKASFSLTFPAFLVSKVQMLKWRKIRNARKFGKPRASLRTFRLREALRMFARKIQF